MIELHGISCVISFHIYLFSDIIFYFFLVAIHELTGQKVAIKILNRKRLKKQDMGEKVISHFNRTITQNRYFLIVQNTHQRQLY